MIFDVFRRQLGSCQVYNGSVCSAYLKDHVIYVDNGKSIAHIERRLAKWFKRSKYILVWLFVFCDKHFL